MLILQLAAAAPPADRPGQQSPFVDGRFECRVVDQSANVSSFTFDFRGESVAVVDGGAFARAGITAKAKSKVGEVGPLKMRQTSFEDGSSGARRSFELAEMVGDGYRANRLVVLTETGGLKGAGNGLVMAVSQLTAIGMCKAALQQGRP